MTGTFSSRRPSRRNAGRRGPAGSGGDGRSAVGEKLRDAREIRGVDIFRVERDTKIRSKFLTALEEGDFTDLPGDVYARGFLRNYASYLGLDADEIEEEWRSEAGAPEIVQPAIVGPQPLTIRRGIVFQRSHGVIAIVVVIVLIVASYFGLQLTRYLSYPTLAVASNGTSPIVVPIGSTSYVLSGTATPGATVLIAWNGQDANIVVADETGHWTYQAPLQAGSNEFDITAENLDTSHASPTVRVIVLVPVPTPTPLIPEVAFSAPADGSAIASGSVTVTGISTEVASVVLTPTYLGPPLRAGATPPPATPSASAVAGPSVAPGASPGPTPTAGPQPMTAATAADGTFSFTLQLTPGRWQLALVGTSPNGLKTAPVTRTVSVPFKGITVLIQVKGGSALVAIYHDGITDNPGHTQAAGWSRTVVGTKYVCIRSTRPGYVLITVNGTSYGPISGFGGQRAYIDVNGPRNISSCP